MLLFESLVKLRTREGDEEAYHGCNDTARLDEPYLGVENSNRVTVKTYNEPTVNLEAGLLNILDTRNKIPVSVLEFAAFCKALLIRGLDADEDNIESCPHHQLHHIFMVGKVYGCLRIKSEGIPSPLHPLNDGRQDLLLQLFLVPDEIIVNKENRASEP